MDQVNMKRASSWITSKIAPFIQGWVGWVVVAVIVYLAGMYLTIGIVLVLANLGLFTSIDTTSFALLTRMIMYTSLIILMISVPLWLKHRTSFKELGLDRLMQWKDIGVGLAGLVFYVLLAMGALALLKLIPGVDVDQAQELDVGRVYGTAMMMVFVVLVVVTPFVEEVLFRGFLYGRLRAHHLPAWVVALIVSVLFGVVHGQLNVGVDVFILSLVACYARELTGSIWAGVVLHMIKNFIAFAIVYLVN